MATTPQGRDDHAHARPLLRGWFHAVAAIGAVGVTAALAFRALGDLPRLASLLVFGLSMIELYSVSAVYHVRVWQGRRRTVLRALDHAGIFVLIAGTFTPFCVNVLAGWLRPAVLILIWAAALAGVSTAVFTLGLPRWTTTVPYLGMGWAALLPLPRIVQLLPWEAVALMLSGGALYTLGAVVYWRRRPDPLPRLLGFHEVFHLLTIAANAAFVVAVWVWVVPFPRS